MIGKTDQGNGAVSCLAALLLVTAACSHELDGERPCHGNGCRDAAAADLGADLKEAGGPDLPAANQAPPKPDLTTPDLATPDVGPPQPDLPTPDAAQPDQQQPDTAPAQPKCGDGKKNGADQCDGTDLGGLTCKSQGYLGGTLKCSKSCALDRSDCHHCGNNKINTQTKEQCDGVDLNKQTCVGLAFQGGALGCKSDCTFDTSRCYKVKDLLGVKLSSETSHQYDPVVACKSGQCLVAWMGGGDVKGKLVSKGVPAAATLTIAGVSGDQKLPTIAFDGTNYLVAWLDWRFWPKSNKPAVYAAHVTGSGTVQDPTGIPISTVANTVHKAPTVSHDGTNYLVVYRRDTACLGHLYGARVTGTGTLVDKTPLSLTPYYAANHHYTPDLCHGGGNYLAVWDKVGIHGTGVSPSGKVLHASSTSSGIPISTPSVGGRAHPSCAHDGADYLVVWHDNRANKIFQIFGARVSC